MCEVGWTDSWRERKSDGNTKWKMSNGFTKRILVC